VINRRSHLKAGNTRRSKGSAILRSEKYMKIPRTLGTRKFADHTARYREFKKRANLFEEKHIRGSDPGKRSEKNNFNMEAEI
jgi:hypothetical protein